ncbi:hypothetical protein AMAG_13954 [Allomyces macrogynus ATCC 38327]|uniref:PB1 domain-containing protein n=1 Tax=Allomyces macrogynus (strain ATCC 38327) TaxID=578462 RepID=A0A0L0T3E7_ALLM3|nr:hypothetical protein AMAG_13954 [Allomyces macrogynus ATCC 38327]|eukprot:KNE69084.1 hypothetical protein AMAG_13954 [Allomyces macrogynus ATCC 38327]
MNSLKQELVQWHEACQAYDNGEYETALDLFNPILNSSRILFNVGMTFLNMGQPQDAVLAFDDAIEHDHYLAVAQFQFGVTHYLLGQYSEAEALFQAALDSTRGNLVIDYHQLGLDFRLYACEVLFNQALSFAQLGETVTASLLLENARKGARTQEHEDRICAGVDHDGAEPFRVPPKCLFRPPAAKLSNMSKTRFVGHSKVVAAVRSDDRDLDAMKRLSIADEPVQAFSGTLTRTLQSPVATTPRDLPRDLPPRPPSRSQHPSPPHPPPSHPPPPHPAAQPASESPSFISTRRLSSMGMFRPNPNRAVPRAAAAPPRPARPDEPNPKVRSLPPPPRPRPPSGEHARTQAMSLERRVVPVSSPPSSSSMASPRVLSRPPSPGTSPMASPRVLSRPPSPGRTASHLSRSSVENMRTRSSTMLHVKVHFGDTRMLLLPADATFADLVQAIRTKFQTQVAFRPMFRDMDGELVTMTDDDDVAYARSLAADPNRIHLWCEEL